MIIKGNPAGSVGFWSSHLLRDDTNERAEVQEIRGLTADNLPAALREMQAVAAGSRSHGNFMYAANINPGPGERLTPEQWREAWDTLEKNLGLEGHQRVIVEHHKEGRTHQHAVWNRVDVDTMKVADMGGNWRVHEATARDLESRFDLTPTPTPARGSTPAAPELWEVRAAERSGIDPEQVKHDATTAWNKTMSGGAFVRAIEAQGYVVAKGDRRDFCLVDQAGDVHSLARRLEGVKAAAVREGMADVDRDAMPTVAEARAAQREGAAHRAAEQITRQQAEREAAQRAEQEAQRRAQLEAAAKVEREAAQRAEQEAQRRAARDAAAKIEREAARKPEREAAAQSAWLDRAEAQRADRLGQDPAKEAARAGLEVMDAATGAISKLGDFVVDILAGPKAPPSAAAQDIRAQRRALAALENIRESMERGERLKAGDLEHLTQTHLENIRARGDDYLREMIDRMERERERARSYDRARER